MTSKTRATDHALPFVRRHRHRRLSPVTAAVLAALYGAPSLGGDADHDDNLLEDVVVTATRHAESAQDIPLSITAVSGASLEAAGIADIAGLARLFGNRVSSREANLKRQHHRKTSGGPSLHTVFHEPSVPLN